MIAATLAAATERDSLEADASIHVSATLAAVSVTDQFGARAAMPLAAVLGATAQPDQFSAALRIFIPASRWEYPGNHRGGSVQNGRRSGRLMPSSRL